MRKSVNILKKSIKIHASKNADYTSGENEFENFDRCEQIVSWFKNDIDKVFVTLITVKLARLAVLLSSDKEPNNESVADSFDDLVTYAALWGGKRS